MMLDLAYVKAKNKTKQHFFNLILLLLHSHDRCQAFFSSNCHIPCKRRHMLREEGFYFTC